jgi:hypothetical protein
LPFIAKSHNWDASNLHTTKKLNKKKKKKNPHASLTLSLHSVHPRVVAANSNATTAACLLIIHVLTTFIDGTIGSKIV